MQHGNGAVLESGWGRVARASARSARGACTACEREKGGKERRTTGELVGPVGPHGCHMGRERCERAGEGVCRAKRGACERENEGKKRTLWLQPVGARVEQPA